MTGVRHKAGLRFERFLHLLAHLIERGRHGQHLVLPVRSRVRMVRRRRRGWWRQRRGVPEAAQEAGEEATGDDAGSTAKPPAKSRKRDRSPR